MFKLVTALVIAAAVVACALFGLVAYSVIMAALACLVFALTTGAAGTLVLTNKFGMNYEIAFSRSFWGGLAVASIVVLGWTFTLDLLSGGLTVDFVSHLWDVSLRCAIGAFATAVAVVLVWACMVFGARKSGR